MKSLNSTNVAQLLYVNAASDGRLTPSHLLQPNPAQSLIYLLHAGLLHLKQFYLVEDKLLLRATAEGQLASLLFGKLLVDLVVEVGEVLLQMETALFIEGG